MEFYKLTDKKRMGTLVKITEEETKGYKYENGKIFTYPVSMVPYFMSETEVYGEYEELTEEEFELELLKNLRNSAQKTHIIKIDEKIINHFMKKETLQKLFPLESFLTFIDIKPLSWTEVLNTTSSYDSIQNEKFKIHKNNVCFNGCIFKCIELSKT